MPFLTNAANPGELTQAAGKFQIKAGLNLGLDYKVTFGEIATRLVA